MIFNGSMFNIPEALKKLPEKPGVYIMRDASDEVIYVGKAVNLKNRVRQYFQSSERLFPRTLLMVQKISRFEYIVTDSEMEALILECNLIKKHKPRFNVLLKDDKSYPYIKITMQESYPRIFMTRRVEKDKARYFGPYANVAAVKETIDLIKKLFPVKTCKKVLPRDAGKERPCLNYYIFKCTGPCRGDVDQEEYRAAMRDICSFLRGRQEEVIGKLEKKMRAAAENMEFEKAAFLRDRISSIRVISEKQKVLSTAMEDQDVAALAKGQTDACVQVFFIRGGKLIGREHFIFDGMADTEDSELMGAFIKQFYGAAEYVPGEILLQMDIEDMDLVGKWLSDAKSAKVRLRVPRRGEKRKLVEMVAQNALLAIRQHEEKLMNEGSTAREGLEKLAALTGLTDPPRRIEAYDISNMGSSDVVASMVVFENGVPAPKEYRRFKMKTTTEQDDYASMRETLARRLRRAGKDGTDSFAKLPDLILVDGGLGHVHAAQEVLKEFRTEIPVYGMVKDDRHRTRGLMGMQGENDLKGDLPALRFVTAIQDEAHRFALAYNRKLGEKRMKGSVLDRIDGIGPKRKKALIRHFGSVGKIREAGVDDLAAVDGINQDVAQKIYEYFH